MSQEIVSVPPPHDFHRAGVESLPAPIARAGHNAAWRFIEFFTANIRNRNTRAPLTPWPSRSFFRRCEARGIRDLDKIKPVVIAAHIEQQPGSATTVKQHLAAIRMLFDWLVTGQIIPMNPASSVRGPKYVVRRGKTPVLKADQARTLLDSIEIDTIVGLRDRTLIGLMVYTFGRVSATSGCAWTTTIRTESVGGSGCTRKAANATRSRRTTMRRRIWTPTLRRPKLAARESAAVSDRG